MPTVSERARALHERAIVIDGLLGSLGSADRGLEAGLTAANVTVATYTADFREAIRSIYNHYAMVDHEPGKLLIVENATDVERAKRERKVGLILGFQGMTPIEDDLELVTIFHKLGIRVATLTYMERNLLGDGCLEPENKGLTYTGIQVVKEMNRLGMLIDLSHCGYRVCEDTLVHSSTPVALTHSNARALCDTPRNVPDSIIKGIAAAGGLIGASPYSAICFPPDRTRPRLENFLRHVDYLVHLVGVDHVSIGTDFFDGKGPVTYLSWSQRRYPGILDIFSHADRHAQGFESISRFPEVTAALLDRGYGEADAEKIIGGNLLRLFQTVWRG